MKIFIPNEESRFEKRVALTPAICGKLAQQGYTILLEKKAGETAGFDGSAYENVDHVTRARGIKDADIIVSIAAYTDVDFIDAIKPNTLVIGSFKTLQDPTFVEKLSQQKVTSFSLDLLPRITRAQSMDVLSSQTNLVGYRAVIEAAQKLPLSFPMMMTAAGKVNPVRVLVLGVGVAGLQAIATAKRLGAIVYAYDVRPIVKEQVESLGAKFISPELKEDAETSGGYAKEMGKNFQKAQETFLQEKIGDFDLVITCAMIPGRPAPTLITHAMFKHMKKGALIVDTAIETGGNCQLSKAGEVVKKDGVSVYSHPNMASLMAKTASELYAKNIYNFLQLLSPMQSINWDDEIIKQTCLTREGKIVNTYFLKKD